MSELVIKTALGNGDWDKSFSEYFIESLNEFCLDHYKHFEAYPLEFEFEDKVYKWKEYCDYIKFDEIEDLTFKLRGIKND